MHTIKKERPRGGEGGERSNKNVLLQIIFLDILSKCPCMVKKHVFEILPVGHKHSAFIKYKTSANFEVTIIEAKTI